MNKSSKPAGAVWGWRRWIQKDHEEQWTARLQAAGCPPWTMTERPDRVRLLLAIYQEHRAEALRLKERFGGQVRKVRDEEWLPAGPTPPTRIGKLEIAHEEQAPGTDGTLARLHIPHGMAFGSGGHATTFMLLRALTARGDWSGTSVLDLGTGSGVLALAARKFGATKIVATDFDAEAVRTARQNEALNFPTALIRWQCGDVKWMKASTRYGLVLANLFSGILCVAAPQIAGSVAAGGELWVSGVLRSQKPEVVAAYQKQGLVVAREVLRGKWVLVIFRR